MKRWLGIGILLVAGWLAAFQITEGQERSDHKQVFADVQKGLLSGSVRTFSRYLSSQVSVNLRGGENGYYSANQTTSLLESYLKTRKLSNLSFSTIGESESAPFATGSATLSYRGSRELAQVYVALKPSGNHWVITQINIY